MFILYVIMYLQLSNLYNYNITNSFVYSYSLNYLCDCKH